MSVITAARSPLTIFWRAASRRPELPPISRSRSGADQFPIFFTTQPLLEQPRAVRWFVAICCIVLFVPKSPAQRQEPSLVDRLLRPSMELQNNAQGKKFAANSALIERRGTVGTFFLQPNRTEKSFVGAHTLMANEYPSRSASLNSRTSIPNQDRSTSTPLIQTSSVGDVHDAHDAHRTTPGRNFADQHQFREQGASQKSLDRQNPPLTIDQVRELLNKNK